MKRESNYHKRLPYSYQDNCYRVEERKNYIPMSFAYKKICLPQCPSEPLASASLSSTEKVFVNNKRTRDAFFFFVSLPSVSSFSESEQSSVSRTRRVKRIPKPCCIDALSSLTNILFPSKRVRGGKRGKVQILTSLSSKSSLVLRIFVTETSRLSIEL